MNWNRLLSRPSESDHLLQNADNRHGIHNQLLRIVHLHCNLNHLCLPSKAGILILFWTFIVGAMYSSVLGVELTTIMDYTSNLSVHNVIPFAILAFIMIFYPLSGYIADTCCGRLKTIMTSSCLLLVCSLLYSFGGIIFWTTGGNHVHLKDAIIFHEYFFGTSVGIVLSILAITSLFLFMLGMMGYQANFIQLGLDQLFEARSHFLSLFIHYAVWIFHLGGMPVAIVLLFEVCIKTGDRATAAYFTIPSIFILCLIVLQCISCLKYNWFYNTPSQSSPYKTVYRILKFVRRNKYPLQRSAFTYDDEYIPSRLDFAKERFGGPFTTEQVENFKAFLRILLILFTLGPVFVLEVPASYFVFPFFSLHTLHYHNFDKNLQLSCTGEDIWETLLGSGTMIAILSTLILFPVYIWITFSVLHNRPPKIFPRLGVGVVICLLGVASLLITDVVGHSMLNKMTLSTILSVCFNLIKFPDKDFPILP